MGPQARNSRIICFLLVLGVSGMLHTAASAAQWHAKGDASQLESAAHRRKLLACFTSAKPTHKTDNDGELPFCSKQYANTGTEWVPVEDGVMNEALKATAADVVYAWLLNPENPKTDSSLKCSGNVTKTRTRCWAGDRVRSGSVYENIDCCTTNQQCFVKTGGCIA